MVKLSGIILLPWYLRLMSQEEFGLYGYLFSMVAYLSTLVNGGFYLVQSKLYLEYPEKERGKVLFTLNFLLFCIFLVVSIIMLISNLDRTLFQLLFKHPFDYSLFRLPLLTGVFVTVFGMMITYYFLASRSIKKLQVYNILRSALIHTVVLSLLYWSPVENGAYIRVSGSYYTELVLVVSFMFIFSRSMTFQWSGKIARESTSLVLPISLYAFFSLIIFTCDRFFIEHYGTLNDLAIYNLAWVLAGVIPFISNSVHSIWLPELLSIKDSKALGARIKSMAIKLVLGFGLISLLTIGVVKLLIVFSVIDNKYKDVVPVLPIVLIGSMILSIFQLVFNFLLSISKTVILVYISLAVALLGVLVTRFLVAKWGFYGAATSMVIMNLGLLIPSALYSLSYYKKNSLSSVDL